MRDFINDAYKMTKSAQRRAQIAQIAVLVGVMIVSEGVGSFAEGAIVGEAASASMARIVASKLAGATINAATFTTLDAALMKTPLAQAFASSFIGNLATLGAMEGTRAILKVSGIAAKASKAGALAWVAKATNISAPMIAAAAVQVVQQEAESELRQGRTMSWDELIDSGTQTIAMMIGSTTRAPRARRSRSPKAKEAGRDITARARSRAPQLLQTLAAKVTAEGNPGEALALIDETRAMLQERVNVRNEELAAGHLDKGQTGEATRAKQRAVAELASLDTLEGRTLPAQLGLDAIVPGHVYAGSSAAVDKVRASYEARGYTVTPTADGYTASKASESPLYFRVRDGASDAPIAAVPGSTFKGASSVPPETRVTLEAAKAELATLAAAHNRVKGPVAPTHVPDRGTVSEDVIDIARGTTIVPLVDGSTITIRHRGAAGWPGGRPHRDEPDEARHVAAAREHRRHGADDRRRARPLRHQAVLELDAAHTRRARRIGVCRNRRAATSSRTGIPSPSTGDRATICSSRTAHCRPAATKRRRSVRAIAAASRSSTSSRRMWRKEVRALRARISWRRSSTIWGFAPAPSGPRPAPLARDGR